MTEDQMWALGARHERQSEIDWDKPFTCSYCGSDTTECRQAATLGEWGAPCGA